MTRIVREGDSHVLTPRSHTTENIVRQSLMHLDPQRWYVIRANLPLEI